MTGKEIEPICGMDVDTSSEYFVETDEKSVYFCSDHCREKFLSGEDSSSSNEASPGAALNQIGSFLMKATKVGRDTVLSRIIRMVSAAQRSRAQIQKLADRFAAVFVPTVIGVAVLTFVVWSRVGPEPRFAYALVNAVALLITALILGGLAGAFTARTTWHGREVK